MPGGVVIESHDERNFAHPACVTEAEEMRRVESDDTLRCEPPDSNGSSCRCCCRALAALTMGQSIAAQTNDQKTVGITERIVQVQTKDDIADAGALYTPPKSVAKPFAVIWIHGANY